MRIRLLLIKKKDLFAVENVLSADELNYDALRRVTDEFVERSHVQYRIMTLSTTSKPNHSADNPRMRPFEESGLAS